jgi:hypothetical protein
LLFWREGTGDGRGDGRWAEAPRDEPLASGFEEGGGVGFGEGRLMVTFSTRIFGGSTLNLLFLPPKSGMAKDGEHEERERTGMLETTSRGNDVVCGGRAVDNEARCLGRVSESAPVEGSEQRIKAQPKAKR